MKAFFAGVVCLFAGACLGAGSVGKQEYSYYSVEADGGDGDGHDEVKFSDNEGEREIISATAVNSPSGASVYWRILYRVKK